MILFLRSCSKRINTQWRKSLFDSIVSESPLDTIKEQIGNVTRDFVKYGYAGTATSSLSPMLSKYMGHKEENSRHEKKHSDDQGHASLMFACPYYKLDSRHSSRPLEGRFVLRKFSDIQNHTRRYLMARSLYCPQCNLEFEEAWELNFHRAGKMCTAMSSDNDIEIRNSALSSFYGLRGLIGDERWFSMWDSLHLGTLTSKPSRLGSIVDEESMPLLSDIQAKLPDSGDDSGGQLDKIMRSRVPFSRDFGS
jgi:hypothetical protein